MPDLIGAILMLSGLSIVAGAIGFHSSRRLPRYQRIRIQLISLVLLALYSAFLWNHPRITKLIPSPNVVILGNWLPIWATFFVGMYLGNRRIHFVRRIVLGALTAGLAAYSTIAPITGEPPVCEPSQNVSGRLQYQTTPYTCSAASAATLLRLHGIHATEAELASLLLTRQGTHWQGVYRGLRIKTAGSNWQVEVVPVDSTTVHQISTPCVLSLNFDTSSFNPDIDHGFDSNQGHSIVHLGNRGHDYIKVFDPSPDYGVEDWGPQTLNSISHGVAFILKPTEDRPGDAQVVQQRIASTLIRKNVASR